MSPVAALNRADTCVATSELPPRSKKLSPARTSGTSSSEAKTSATVRSSPASGSRPVPRISRGIGVGNALRSSLPTGVNGMASIGVIDDGIM